MITCPATEVTPTVAVDPAAAARLQRELDDALSKTSLIPDALAEFAKLEKVLARHRMDEGARALHKHREALDERLALAILGGQVVPPKTALGLAKRLAGYKQLGLARRVLKLATSREIPRDDPSYREIFQKSALYTYKDPDLPAEWRLDRALEILRVGDDLATTDDPESLGLAGAIQKRRWELSGSRRHLERALSFYLRGYALGAPAQHRDDVLAYLRHTQDACFDAARDRGYCGINASFILDLLAYEEEQEGRRLGVPVSTAAARRADARLIRWEIVRSVPTLREGDGAWLNEEWWFHATIGEAYFGLRKYCKALRWLVSEPARAGLKVGFDRLAPTGLDVPEWEYESTARQLARLARLQARPGISEEEFGGTHAAKTLRRFLRNDERAVASAFRGKFGLALSGGGFRASLFHIGVLARLAEADLLRHVEALSCVSGGSIVGAHYYLMLRKLLEEVPDGHVKPEAYVQLVHDLAREFLAGVQKNIRTRVLAGPITNLKMIFWPGYSRTQRVGELYEKHLYARVKDGWQGRRRLADLRVRPRLPTGGQQEDFHPRNHNWRRDNKVPTLVLNATSLNTGHDWQFTATYMGEPPTPINADIDANERLRRVHYVNAPPPHGDVSLGQAVAASSCVPGLFEPLVLDGLYPDRSVRLVDGGVCDNQGVASLIEQDCSVMLVSDGSGQMDAEAVPSDGILGVPLRSNSILQARVREAQYVDLNARRRSGAIRAMMFVHLREDLPGDPVAWTRCPPALATSDFERNLGQRDRTAYGVGIELQRRLAAIRTDLDSFSDAEADALMTSAYWMTDHQLASPALQETLHPAPASGDPERWPFLQWTQRLAPDAKAAPHLVRLLQVSGRSAFKIWCLSRPLIIAKWTMLAASLVAATWAVWRWSAAPIVSADVAAWARSHTVGHLALAAITMLGFLFLSHLARRVLGPRTGAYAVRLVRFRGTLRDVAVGVGMGLFGWIVAWGHLRVFDPLYLRYGSRKRIPM